MSGPDADRRLVQRFVLTARLWLERGYPAIAAGFLDAAACHLRRKGGDRTHPRRPGKAGKAFPSTPLPEADK
jgi:hypothetical protein